MLDFNLHISEPKQEVTVTMKLYSTHRYSFIFSAFLISFFLALNFAVLSQTEDQPNDPVWFFNRGQDAHEKGDFKTALKFYEDALKISPEFPEAEYQKGSALQSLGRETEAEKSFRRALELRGNWVLPMTSLGEILVRNQKFSEAETVLNKVIELDDNNSAAYLGLVEIRIKSHAPPEMLKILRQKLLNLPNPDAAVWAARGALEKELGEKISAHTSLSRALALDPKNSFALAASTEFLLSEKNYRAALEQVQNLVGFYPNSTRAKILLATVLAESGNSVEALKIIDSLESPDSEANLLRTRIVAKSSADVSLLEKELVADPQNAVLLGRLCILTRTNPAKALEYCRQASNLEPNNVGHAIGFGAALVQAKQFEPAINLFNKLLVFEPENYSIHANLATSLFELKRFAEAQTEFQWLIAKKPDLSVAYYFLAIAHDNLAEYSQAKINYQKFLEIADNKINQLEIEKVNLRLPTLERQIKNGEGVKKGKKQ